jgi:Tfp pilus assembly protein PilV
MKVSYKKYELLNKKNKTKKMKKNLIALVIVSVATLAGISGAKAQIASNSSSLEYQMNATNTKNSMNELAISPRALKDFAYSHKNVTGESWTKVKGGFSVRFLADNVTTTIYYDKKGNWAGSLKSYGEEKMLHDIRHIVKSTYYDYNIVYTQEIETTDSDGVPTYVVCVEDKTKIKMIRVVDGEMSEWKEYIKTK